MGFLLWAIPKVMEPIYAALSGILPEPWGKAEISFNVEPSHGYGYSNDVSSSSGYDEYEGDYPSQRSVSTTSVFLNKSNAIPAGVR